jgi:hypothetical protein
VRHFFTQHYYIDAFSCAGHQGFARKFAEEWVTLPRRFFYMKLQSFMLRCDAPSWGLYLNHFP